jgi:hypothetical protein
MVEQFGAQYVQYQREVKAAHSAVGNRTSILSSPNRVKDVLRRFGPIHSEQTGNHFGGHEIQFYDNGVSLPARKNWMGLSTAPCGPR